MKKTLLIVIIVLACLSALTYGVAFYTLRSLEVACFTNGQAQACGKLANQDMVTYRDENGLPVTPQPPITPQP